MKEFVKSKTSPEEKFAVVAIRCGNLLRRRNSTLAREV